MRSEINKQKMGKQIKEHICNNTTRIKMIFPKYNP